MNFRIVDLKATPMTQQLGRQYFKTKKEALAKAHEYGWSLQKRIGCQWVTWSEEKKAYFL